MKGALFLLGVRQLVSSKSVAAMIRMTPCLVDREWHNDVVESAINTLVNSGCWPIIVGIVLTWY